MEKKNFISLLDNLTLDEKINAESYSIDELYKIYPENIIYFETYEKRKNHKRIYFGDNDYPLSLYYEYKPPYFIDYIGTFPKKNIITSINNKEFTRTLDREGFKFALESNLNGYNLLVDRKGGVNREILRASLINSFPIFTISHLGIFGIEEKIDKLSNFQLLSNGGILTSSNPFSNNSDLENYIKKDTLFGLSENVISFSLVKNSFSYKIVENIAERGGCVFCHKEGLFTNGIKDLVLSGIEVVSSSSEMLEKLNKEVKGYLYSNTNGEYTSPFGSFSFISYC